MLPTLAKMLFLSLAGCARCPLLSVVKEDLGVPVINCSCTSHGAVNVGTVALLPCENSTHGKVPGGCGFGDQTVFETYQLCLCAFLTGCVCPPWHWGALQREWRLCMACLMVTRTKSCHACCSAPWPMCSWRRYSSQTPCSCPTPSWSPTGRTVSKLVLMGPA